MKPPSSHVDELQSVVSAHDLSVTQNIQLWNNQEIWCWHYKKKIKRTEYPDNDDEEEDDAGHKLKGINPSS